MYLSQVVSHLTIHLQGVFGFRGKRTANYNDELSTSKRAKKGQKAKKAKAKTEGNEVIDDLDLGMMCDDDSGLSERYATFKTLWAKVLDVYTSVLHQNFGEIIQNVGDFVSNAGNFVASDDHVASG